MFVAATLFLSGALVLTAPIGASPQRATSIVGPCQSEDCFQRILGAPSPVNCCVQGCLSPSVSARLSVVVRDCMSNPIAFSSVLLVPNTTRQPGCPLMAFTDFTGHVDITYPPSWNNPACVTGPPTSAALYADGVPLGSVAITEVGCSAGPACQAPGVQITGTPLLVQTADTLNVLLRHPNLPQGFGVTQWVDRCYKCAEPNHVRSAFLIPRSGTGQVIPLQLLDWNNYYQQMAGWFQVTSLTAPGFYDTVVECSDGTRDTLRNNVVFRGFAGYNPSGLLVNALTGNVIRNARVSLWRMNTSGGYEWYDGQVASDGSYSFQVIPGIYRVLVQYDLAGEQWRGPIVVSSPQDGISGDGAFHATRTSTSLPYEVTQLVPATADATPPAYQELEHQATRVQGMVRDPGVGLSVVEIVPDSTGNVSIGVPPFTQGADSVVVDLALVDSTRAGSATLRLEDQLGNFTTVSVSLAGVTGVGDPVVRDIRLGLAQPNPFRETAAFELRLAHDTTLDATVFDLLGRRIARVAQGTLGMGVHLLRWDGRDDLGRPVPAGLYVLWLRAGEARESRAIVKLH